MPIQGYDVKTIDEICAANVALVEALKRTLDLAVGHACEARKCNADEAETWSWVQRARAALKLATEK